MKEQGSSDGQNNKPRMPASQTSFPNCGVIFEPMTFGTALSIVVFLLFLSITIAADASVYYVAKSGNDSSPGTETAPWLTIQKAASTALKGETVYIKKGIYYENVSILNSGTDSKYITFQAYPENHVVVDGGGAKNTVLIQGKSYIRIKDIHITNGNPYGVLIEGSSFIELKDTVVSETNCECIQIRGDSHFIAVENCETYGQDNYSGMDIYTYGGKRPSDITIRHSTFRDSAGVGNNCRGISSEQADRIIVDGCVVYGHNQVGIDIGSGINNVVRNSHVYNCETGIAVSSNLGSIIHDNVVHDIINEGLYSYFWALHGEEHSKNKWYNNKVYNTGRGFWERRLSESSFSSEHELHNNLFYNNKYSIRFERTGKLKFYNNTVYASSGYHGLEVWDNSLNSLIENNIISTSGSNSYPVRVESGSTESAAHDYNCYDNRDGNRVVEWGNTVYIKGDINDRTFATNTGNGWHSIAGNPAFVDPVNDFGLQEGSPCINTGNPAYSVPRGGGNRIDMGAIESIEFVGSGPMPPIDLRVVDPK